MKKKTILLCISGNNGISKLIEKNLQLCGFEVILLSPYNEKNEGFKYPSLWSNFKVKFKKIILNNKDAKSELQSSILLTELKNKLNGRKIDYSLFFLAQSYSIELIQYIKHHTNKGGMINYQWDGIDRYPNIHKRIPLFDKVFVFDSDDLIKGNFLPTTNFYFNSAIMPTAFSEENNGFYFIGSHIDERKDIIREFALFSKKRNYSLNFNIFCEKSKDLSTLRNFYPDNIKIFDKNGLRSYEENLCDAKKSFVLVDFVNNIHSGLSFRTFEALAYNKKLITTNKKIIKYDFYHPSNIFILDNNFVELDDFLNKPYVKIDSLIKQKYLFDNWIKYILDIPPYQPILLPK